MEHNFNFPHPSDFRHWKFAPWYDERADYETNAKSYYDYLARLNKFLQDIGKALNQLFAEMHVPAQFKLENGVAVDINTVKIFDNHQNPLVTLRVDGVDNQTATLDFSGLIAELNDIQDQLDAIRARLDSLEARMTAVENRVTSLENRMTTAETNITNLQNEMGANNNFINKLVQNLINQGAWTGDKGTGSFATGQSVASGNINLYSQDETHYIKTRQAGGDYDLIGAIISSSEEELKDDLLTNGVAYSEV